MSQIQDIAVTKKDGVSVFTFGEPEPTRGIDFINTMQCYSNGKWYEPPFLPDAISRLFQLSPHHASAIILKRNLLTDAFVPNKYLSRSAFSAMVFDLLVFGNAYCEIVKTKVNTPYQIRHAMALYTRRGVEDDQFFWVPLVKDYVEFENQVVQIRQPDFNQEIYGLPEYLGAMQSAALNHASTVFRMRYYRNGSHAGFILYMSGNLDNDSLQNIKQQLEKSRGQNNFKNMVVHSPNGKKGDIELIPIAEVGAKDEFLNIKNVTRDDILASHRVPPQLLGMVPPNGSGFGDVSKAMESFYQLEIKPLTKMFEEVNDVIGQQIISFELPALQ